MNKIKRTKEELKELKTLQREFLKTQAKIVFYETQKESNND